MDTKTQIQQLKDSHGQLFAFNEAGNFKLEQPELPPAKFILVQSGSFTMGQGKEDDEKPHEVKLTNSFYMAEFPVTQALYKAVTQENPSSFKGDQKPVEKVNWYDAVEFCNKLNLKLGLEPYYEINKEQEDPNNESDYDKLKYTVNINSGAKGFRLPTEAEWEYAAQGGSKAEGKPNEYAGSNSPDFVAWYNKNNAYESKPPGLKFPNALGLYDMSGNVWEWCWDWFADDFYQSPEAQLNPKGPESGSGRVVRGGGWGGNARGSRLANRNNYNPDSRWGHYGFRPVFALSS